MHKKSQFFLFCLSLTLHWDWALSEWIQQRKKEWRRDIRAFKFNAPNRFASHSFFLTIKSRSTVFVPRHTHLFSLIWKRTEAAATSHALNPPYIPPTRLVITRQWITLQLRITLEYLTWLKTQLMLLSRHMATFANDASNGAAAGGNHDLAHQTHFTLNRSLCW